jgi:tRNA-2-methylthio-N6-dimethylallyladenosine synthase
LHLPVQTGADTVLARMRRGYSKKDYLERIQRLRDRCPQIALSSDIIVGFPGETDAEFAATLELLQQVEYDEIFSFMYSPRPQTVSAKIYEDDISEDIKKERLKNVQALQQSVSLKKNRQRIGERVEVLIDGPSKLKNGQMMGRTRSNRIVNVNGAEHHVGKLIPVRITGATANALVGELWRNEQILNSQLEGETA